MNNTTDINQAGEDVIDSILSTLGIVDRKSGNRPGQIEVVKQIIRNEKLKLLAEVRERVVGRNQSLPKRGYINPDIYVEVLHTVEGRNSLRAEQKNLLTKLEAEL